MSTFESARAAMNAHWVETWNHAGRALDSGGSFLVYLFAVGLIGAGQALLSFNEWIRQPQFGVSKVKP